MAQTKVEREAVLPHPVARVFAAAADPFTQLEWDAVTLRRVEQLSDGPLGPGARYRGTFKGLGVVDYEFAVFEPDRRFTHLARIPMGELEHAFIFEAAPDGTRLRQVGELRPNLLGRLGAPVMRRMLEHRFHTIAIELDRYLRRTNASAAWRAADRHTEARRTEG
jgi:Polyketide cyclase / dehydrase and lipid transport